MEKLHLLPKLTNDEFNLLLTSVGCALQKCDQLDDKNSKQAEKEKGIYIERNILKYFKDRIGDKYKLELEEDFSL